MINVFKIDDHLIQEDWAVCKQQRNQLTLPSDIIAPQKKLSWEARMHVSNLKDIVSEADIEEAFKKYTVEDVMIYRGDVANVYASIQFCSQDEMVKALTEKIVLHDKELVLKPWRPVSRKSPVNKVKDVPSPSSPTTMQKPVDSHNNLPPQPAHPANPQYNYPPAQQNIYSVPLQHHQFRPVHQQQISYPPNSYLHRPMGRPMGSGPALYARPRMPPSNMFYPPGYQQGPIKTIAVKRQPDDHENDIHKRPKTDEVNIGDREPKENQVKSNSMTNENKELYLSMLKNVAASGSKNNPVMSLMSVIETALKSDNQAMFTMLLLQVIQQQQMNINHVKELLHVQKQSLRNKNVSQTEEENNWNNNNNEEDKENLPESLLFVTAENKDKSVTEVTKQPKPESEEVVTDISVEQENKIIENKFYEDQENSLNQEMNQFKEEFVEPILDSPPSKRFEEEDELIW